MIKALFTASIVGTSLLAFGQDARPLVGKDIAAPSARFPAEWYPKETGMSTTAPIAGAPFSATVIMTTEALDSDGRSVGVARNKTLEWRDSAGRLRDEELPTEVEGHPNALEYLPHQITAVDTIQHCQFTWSEPAPQDQQHEAVVSCNSLEVSRTDDSLAKRMSDPKSEVVHEQLGTLTSTATSTPLGKRVLQNLEAVGIVIWEMTGIERNEPDAKLFYPPEGYFIRKEAETPPLPLPTQP